MNTPAETIASRRDLRECAYVAMRYVLDGRAAPPIKGLRKPGRRALALLAALDHPERTARARTLAAALEPIVRALDARRVG